jgi:copper chaperone
MQWTVGIDSKIWIGTWRRVRFIHTPGGYLHLDDREVRMGRESLKLSIEGMHCGGCVRRVAATLARMDGVEVGAVEVGSAEMTFDPGRVNAGEIAAAIDRIGLTARVERS